MSVETTTCQLVCMMLETALLGKPYPGQVQGTTFFPDIEWVVDREEIVISNRFLGNDVDPEIPNYKIQVLTDDQLNAQAAVGGFPYFSLTEAAIGTAEATLSLELRWMAGTSGSDQVEYQLGGGGVRVRFEQVNGEWQAPAGPIATWMS